MNYNLLLILNILLSCIFIFNVSSFAEDRITTLKPVVVTGTLIPEALERFPGNITIIDKEYIDSSHADNISELLRTVPGLYSDQLGARGGTSSIYIRGADPNFTLILLDGIRLNDPNNTRGGSFDLSTISTDSIERIEIVKGPKSSIYGSDALAGVINIITHKGGGDNIKIADVSITTDNGFRILTEARGEEKKLNYSLSASFLNDGEPVEGSKFKSPTFIANIGHTGDEFSIQSVTRYSYIDSSAFPDDSGGDKFAVIRETEERNSNQFLTGINANYNIDSWWVNNLVLNFTLIDEDVTSPGVAPGERDPFGIPANDIDSNYYRLETKYHNIFYFLEKNALLLGLDFQYEKGENRGVIFTETENRTEFNESRFIVSPLAQFKFSPIRNLFIDIGARLDIPEGFDTEFSPYIGILYKITETRTRLIANWGEGFKLPSFFALGNPIVGNPGLNPETSSSYEVKVEQELPQNIFVFSVAYFFSDYKNLIDLDEGPPPSLVNRGNVEISGIELELRTKQIYNAVITCNLSYIETDIIDSEQQLRNRPNWLANLVLLWMPVKAVEVYLSANYVGEFLDSSIPTGDRMLGDYLVVDTSLTVFLRKNIEAYIVINNLLNEKYEQFVGFSAPGIRPTFGLRWKFN